MSTVRALNQDAMLPEAEAKIIEAGVRILRREQMSMTKSATLGAIVAAHTEVAKIRGPYAGVKKCLNRDLWEKDRKKRKQSRKSRKRNR